MVDRRKFLKTCGALMVLPSLVKLDGVAQCFVGSGVVRESLVSEITYMEFVELLLRDAAQSLGVPYRMLNIDYRKQDFLKIEAKGIKLR